MKAFDVVAYACEGDLYCPEHADFEASDVAEGYVTPVFAGDEGWQEHCCFTCSTIAAATGERLVTLGEDQ